MDVPFLILKVPDLVVEIISPSSSFNDSVKKREIYQRYGVKEYWLVFSEERAIECWPLRTAFTGNFARQKRKEL